MLQNNIDNFKKQVSKYQEETKEFLSKWEDKSREFIHNFLDHFANSQKRIKARVDRAISPNSRQASNSDTGEYKLIIVHLKTIKSELIC